jgi:MFS family permease
MARTYTNLIVLTVAQAFAQTGGPVVILLGGLVGGAMAPSASLATLPIALMIVGTATTTVPAALVMQRYGRKAGFIGGAAYASLAGVLGAIAIGIESFWLFCLATFVVGSHNAFVQQYRFAAAESVPPEQVGPAVSTLMLAGVAAAFIGPEVATRFHDAVSWGEYAGSFLGYSAMMVCAILCLLFYQGGKLKVEPSDTPVRPLREIALTTAFITAVAAALVGYAVMSLIMTATPVSMHAMDHFSLRDTTWVIQSHIVAMFLPSLFSGFLIVRFGAENIVRAGLGLMFACIVVGFIDRELLHYWVALVLLGIGWNFLFVGGTTLLTRSYSPAERFKVQALNDFLIFGLQAVAALASGVILATLGWYWVLSLSLPWLMLLLAIFCYAPRRQTA